jgi:hypothetical protein
MAMKKPDSWQKIDDRWVKTVDELESQRGGLSGLREGLLDVTAALLTVVAVQDATGGPGEDFTVATWKRIRQEIDASPDIAVPMPARVARSVSQTLHSKEGMHGGCTDPDN